MSTTLDALQNRDNPTIAFVLAIEGYEDLLTSWVDTSAVATAWAGTGWTSAVRGLIPPKNFHQEIVPLEPRLNGEEMVFTVLATDDDDSFGIAVHKVRPRSTAVSTELELNITPASASIEVKSTRDFPSSGVIYIGNERIEYSSSTATTFNGLTRGKYSPHSTSDGDNTWTRGAVITSYTYGATVPPKVTNYRPTFLGAWVGLWAHRVVGGVLDTKAEAACIYAGSINDIIDVVVPNKVGTNLVCDSVLGRLNKVTLLDEQLVGKVREGLYFKAAGKVAGDASDPQPDTFQIRLREVVRIIVNSQVYDYEYIARPLRAVEGTATTTYEIEEGWYTLPEIIVKINLWLDGEREADRILARWGISVPIRVTDLDGLRLELSIDFKDSVTVGTSIGCTLEMSGTISRFMGFFESPPKFGENGGHLIDIPISNNKGSYVTGRPYRIMANSDAATSNNGVGVSFPIESKEGHWAYQPATLLPRSYRLGRVGVENPNLGEIYLQDLAPDTPGTVVYESNIGYVMVDGKYLLYGAYTNGYFINAVPVDDLFGKGIVSESVWEAPSRFIDQPDDLEVKQVVIVQANLAELLARIMASTGGKAVNHPEYDILSRQLCAGIPWSLLGDEFINSLVRLGNLSDLDGSTIAILKPTLLGDLILSDLQLRGAHLVFKNGSLIVQQPAIPPQNPGFIPEEYWRLTESNKADELSAQTQDPNYTRSTQTTLYCVNQLKVVYGRNEEDNYRYTIEISNQDSVVALGGEYRSRAIKARNLMGITEDTAEQAYAALSDLSARILGDYGFPLTIINRTVDYTLQGAAPGDGVVITDNTVRDPRDGERGISNYLGWIRSIDYDWSTGIGEIEAVITAGFNATRYSPGGRVDTDYNIGDFTNGWNDTTRQFQLVEPTYGYAEPDSGLYDTSAFEVGDKIRLIGTRPTAWTSPKVSNLEIESLDNTTGRVTVTEIPFEAQSLTWENDVNVSISGQTITKDAGGLAWNAGATSTTSITGDGYVLVSYNDDYGAKVVGLSNGDTDQDKTDIDFGLLLSFNSLYAYESGVDVGGGVLATIVEGDTAKVQTIDGTVTYWHNSTLVHTSSGTPSFPLLVDTSIQYEAAKITAEMYAPAYDGAAAASYFITPQGIEEVATQQLTTTYLSASGTSVVGEQEAYLYSPGQITTSGTGTTVSGTDLPEYIPPMLTASGSPLSPVTDRLITDVTNNMINYKSCDNVGNLLPPVSHPTTTSGVQRWYIAGGQYVYTGMYSPPIGHDRKIYVSPLFGLDGTAPSGTKAHCRVTISNTPPEWDSSTDSTIGFDLASSEPYHRAEWETTSTSMVYGTASGISIPGIGPYHYVLVEVKSDHTDSDVEYGGVPRLYTGPLETIL